MDFKFWLENEYDLPDESAMNRIRQIPLSCDLVPDFRGDLYRFKMPMGREEFLINRGSIIGLKAARGSLNARCFALLEKRDYQSLYRLLSYVKYNNNKRISSQLIFHHEK